MKLLARTKLAEMMCHNQERQLLPSRFSSYLLLPHLAGKLVAISFCIYPVYLDILRRMGKFLGENSIKK